MMRRFLLLSWWLLLLLPTASHAQSRRLRRLWVALAQHPQPGLAREQALWALAWEKEVALSQQDSLARLATALAQQLRDPVGQLAGQVAVARRQLVRGQRAAAQATLRPVLAAARRRGAAELQVLVLVMLGRTYWGTAQHAQVLGCWQQAWAAAQHQPDPYWRVRTAILQGNFYDNYAQGLPWYFRGLRLAQQLDCQACQADALGGIGYDYLQLQELGLAERYLRQNLAVQRQVVNRAGQGQALISLASLYLERRQYPAAEAALRRATALAPTAADSLAAGAALASALAQQGQDARAQAQARGGLRLARQLGHVDQVTFLEFTLASSYLHQGRLDSALRYGQRAYAHRQGGAERHVLASTCQLLARAYAACGTFAQAYAFQSR
ncbi:MAG: tetratricopeptide repeat protein, partial [Hymenobacter sp.]